MDSGDQSTNKIRPHRGIENPQSNVFIDRVYSSDVKYAIRAKMLKSDLTDY